MDISRVLLIGCRIVRSSSFIGGPNDMRKECMDVRALTPKHRDAFLTMICNSNWLET